MTEPNSDSARRTLDPNKTVNGRVIAYHSLFLGTTPFSFAELSPASSRIWAILRFRMTILYVSRKHVMKVNSHATASPAARSNTARHPIVWAIEPPRAGPMAPPMSGANVTRLKAEPRCSDSKISPMMAGLRTFEATAAPVNARAPTKRAVLSLNAARSDAEMNKTLHTFITG